MHDRGLTGWPADDPARAFLGVGWAFPPRFDADGHIAEAAYEEDVRQAIRIILGTNPGERVMRPDFGAGLDRFVFEPITLPLTHALEVRVRDALIAWEPRIDVRERARDPAGRPPNVLMIELDYRVRATNIAGRTSSTRSICRRGPASDLRIEPRAGLVYGAGCARRRDVRWRPCWPCGPGYVPEWRDASSAPRSRWCRSPPATSRPSRAGSTRPRPRTSSLSSSWRHRG